MTRYEAMYVYKLHAISCMFFNNKLKCMENRIPKSHFLKLKPDAWTVKMWNYSAPEGETVDIKECDFYKRR